MSLSPTPQAYSDWQGVDLSLPAAIRPIEIAETMQNCQFLQSGAVVNRPGFKYSALNEAGLGYLLYHRMESGNELRTRLAIGLTLREVRAGSVQIVYVGAAVSVQAQVLFDSTTAHWYFQFIEDDVETFRVDLGTGIDEPALPFTLFDLVDHIGRTVPFYTATVVGVDTDPVAFLPTQVALSFSGVPLAATIPFEYTAEIRGPMLAANPFLGHFNARNSINFRNAMGLNLQQVLFIATDEDVLKKFDGVAVYSAGVPRGVITSATPTGSSTFSGTYRYKMRYAFYDAQGNYTPGALSDYLEAVPASAANVTVTLPTVQPTSGWMTDVARVNGAHAIINTFAADAGHGLQVGQHVAFYDRAVPSNDALTDRVVTAVTSTSITLDGAAFSLNDNDIVSAGLTLELYRTKDLGNITFLYQLATLPNDSTVASVAFVDTVADTALGPLLTIPRRQYDPPPKGGIITLYQGLPVISGNADEPNRVYFGEPTNPEGFPESTNNFDAYSEQGGPITALLPNLAGLEVFYPASMRRLLGTLADGALEIRDVSLVIGCTSRHAVKQIDDAGKIMWLSQLGPRFMYPGSIPQRFQRRIDAIFTELQDNAGTPASRRMVLERAILVNQPYDKQACLYLPCESETGGQVHPNENSSVWVLDYQFDDFDRWVGPWTGINMAGGAICDNGEFSWIERRYSTANSNMTYNVVTMANRHDEFDQVDHHLPIQMVWKPGWETAGSWTLKKLFEWIQVWSIDPQRLAMFTVELTIEKDFRSGVAAVGPFAIALGKGGGGAGWQFEPWGFFPWGMPETPYAEEAITDAGAFALRPVITHEVIYEKVVINFLSMMVKSSYHEGRAR